MQPERWYLSLLFLVTLFWTVCGRSILPVYKIDKACALEAGPGGKNMDVSMKRTFELWSGAKIPVESLPGDIKLFTGFKVHRIFYFRNVFQQAGRSLRVTYCNEGKIVFETEKPITTETDDWDAPWCFFESGDGAGNDLNSFHCLKMARRKKYAIRPFDFFIPYTWVGGLFYCDIDSMQKQALVQTLQTDGQIKSNSFQDSALCTLSNSIPIQPLHASTYADSWTEVLSKKLVPFVSLLSKRNTRTLVSYMQTPNLSFTLGNFSLSNYYTNGSMSPLPRFEQKLGTHNVLMSLYNNWRKQDPKVAWFQEIEVSEGYHYNKEDSDKLGTATSKLRELILPYLEPGSLKKNDPSLSWKAFDKVVGMSIWRTLGITDKLLSVKIPKILNKCAAFLNYWDNMRVSEELFQYTHL